MGLLGQACITIEAKAQPISGTPQGSTCPWAKLPKKSALSASRRGLLTGNAEIGGKICSEAPLCARCEKMCWASLCYLLKVCKKKVFEAQESLSRPYSG